MGRTLRKNASHSLPPTPTPHCLVLVLVLVLDVLPQLSLVLRLEEGVRGCVEHPLEEECADHDAEGPRGRPLRHQVVERVGQGHLGGGGRGKLQRRADGGNSFLWRKGESDSGGL